VHKKQVKEMNVGLFFVIDVRGSFNKRYSNASGTVRFTGSFRGSDPIRQYAGLLVQYRNCDSGEVAWSAHRSATRSGRPQE
jgi:hypothetical protein